jgi:membrane protein YdbS with pleckstrin-like domain
VRTNSLCLCVSMKRQEVTLHKSPFVFLKRAALLIFFFALLPAVVALLVDLREQYATSPVAKLVPDYTLFIMIFLAVLQFVLVVLAFASWYFPVTIVNLYEIVHKPGPLSADKKLVLTPLITSVEIKQGPLGRRLEYGTLAINSSDSPVPVLIKDISNPSQAAETIQRMIDPNLAPRAALEMGSVLDLIAQGESQHVEFKASLLWDYNRQAVNKDLYEPVMKNVAAFMNTVGGTVLVGVSDNGEALGLEQDFAGLPKKNLDGWENAFNMAFNQIIGAEFRQYVHLEFENIAEMTLCAIQVQPASAPVFLTFKGKEEFYIRTGNSTQPLTVSKATTYIQMHFKL